MPGEDIGEVAAPAPADLVLQPARERRVLECAHPTGQFAVGDLADHAMGERELHLILDQGVPDGADEAPGLQFQQAVADRRGGALAEGFERAAPERRADYRGIGQRALGRRGQGVDAGRDHRLDRVRQSDEVSRRLSTGVRQQTRELLRKERVALGTPGDEVHGDVVAPLHLGQRGDQRPGLAAGEPVEPDPRRPASRGGEGRVLLEHVRTRGAEQEQRQVGGVDGHVVDEREQRLVGPVQVLQHEDEGPASGDLVEEPQPRSVVLLGVGLGRVEADERAETLADVAVVRPLLHDALEEPGGRVRVVCLEDARVGLHDLAERPERAVLAVGHAASVPPGDELAARVDDGEQLAHETGLADAGKSDDERHLRRARVDDLAQQADEEVPLAVAADQRREMAAARVPAQPGDRPQREPPPQRPRLALDRDGRQALVRDHAFREPVRELAHDHRARRRGGFEAGGRVDRVARHEAVAQRRVRGAGHQQLPGHDAGPGLEGRTVGPAQLVQALDQSERRAHGALRVVLVDDRDAEHADHGVPDELLHRAAVALDHLARQSAEGPQAGVDVLRVRTLAHRREPHEVAEQRSDRLALFRKSRRLREPRAAGRAEPRSVGPRGPTGRTAAPRAHHAISPGSFTRSRSNCLGAGTPVTIDHRPDARQE